MRKHLLMPLMLILLSHEAVANQSGRLNLDSAVNSELTLYSDKTLVRQSFDSLPNKEGQLVLEGVGSGWSEASIYMEYRSGNKHFFPEKISWDRSSLDRDTLYSKLVGKAVELMGGGLNVPVQGELLVYNKGMGLVQGSNGRQYVVDLNDAQGVRLAFREPVFNADDYTDRITAYFGKEKPEGRLVLSYLTPSLSYTRYYRLTQDAEGKGNLQQRVLIRNDSLINYKQATIRLVSGNRQLMPVGYANASSLRAAPASVGSEYTDERVGEAVVNQIPGTVTLDRYSTLQLTPYRQAGITFEKRYVLDIYGRSFGGRSLSLERPKLVLRFKAGADFPAGRVDMYERSADGSIILSGRAQMPETLKGDQAVLSMGKALAVRIQRKQLSSQQRDDSIQHRWQAILYNDQKEAVTVMLSYHDNSLLKLADVEGGKLENTSIIEVKVPAASKRQITYTAIYGR
ncbi:MAG: hypothetical protein PUP46_03710 [Endozoicomonas sp. (ex Botrylloides leachii)]|nr:hypothetical protein [Endozoicomonas sp. (ex Botrylloides leachii)]